MNLGEVDDPGDVILDWAQLLKLSSLGVRSTVILGFCKIKLMLAKHEYFQGTLFTRPVLEKPIWHQLILTWWWHLSVMEIVNVSILWNFLRSGTCEKSFLIFQNDEKKIVPSITTWMIVAFSLLTLMPFHFWKMFSVHLSWAWLSDKQQQKNCD